MPSYSEKTDVQYAKEIMQHAPSQSKAWLDFDHAVGEVESTIPTKYKELIAIGVALTTQCPYCLDKHTKKAKEAGATKAEIAETIMIAAALRSGAALGYGLLTMKLFNEEEAPVAM